VEERRGRSYLVYPARKPHRRLCLKDTPSDPRDGTVTYYAQSLGIAKSPCKSAQSTYERQFGLTLRQSSISGESFDHFEDR
jgi:hypothetical protein